MDNSPPIVALRERLLNLAQAHPSPVTSESQRSLKVHVWAVVDDLKSAGWPPERVIVAMKQIAADAGLNPSREILSKSAVLTNGDAFVLGVVRWSIERYYETGDQRP